MNGIYGTFATDAKHETAGVWLEYGRTAPSAEFPQGDIIGVKVARAGGKNEGFNKALEKAFKPHRKGIQNGSISVATVEALYMEVFIAHCVLGWKNITNKGGTLLDFTAANVTQVFTDLPDLYADVREQASSLALFREEEREVDLGNSGKSFATAGSKAK